MLVGIIDGCAEGEKEGLNEELVGSAVTGESENWLLGCAVTGVVDDCAKGEEEGTAEGLKLGSSDGVIVGDSEGDAEGLAKTPTSRKKKKKILNPKITKVDLIHPREGLAFGTASFCFDFI